jgi:two-component system, chemotaxis family, protein-glutamate methylesterase/glutaminase
MTGTLAPDAQGRIAERGAQTRDIIVIGSSMGGIAALSTLVSQLPEDLPAAVFVVQHVADESPGLLGDILSRKGPLPAITAEDGMDVRRGRILVAPPNRHLLLAERGVRVTFGPRENRSRPAIDPLFRTAATHYRSRVIGVVLTGLLGDGAAGLLAISRCGGAVVVQAPGDAEFPQVPENALAAVRTAHQAPLAELGALLARLSAQPAPEPPAVPKALQIETRLTERTMTVDDWKGLGESTDLTCPECNGALRAMDDNGARRYRCRVGHAYTTQAWLGEKSQAIEESLWVALQTLQERAQMLEAMARDDQKNGRTRSSATYEERARETREHAARLRELLVELPE